MPSDTFTPLLGLLLQGTGNNDNTWGENLNTEVIELVESAIAGYESIATADANVTLTAAQNRKRILAFTGALTADRNVVVSNLSHSWTMRNACSGSFALKIKTSSGTAVTLPVGWSEVWCDGGDTIYVGPSSQNFDTQMAVADGSVGAPGYSFSSDLDTGIRRKGANNGTLVANGADVLEWLTTGVNITGDVAISGALTVGGSRPVPIGSTISFSGVAAPTGWLFAYGQAVSRTTYSELYGVITKTATATRSNGSTSLTSVSVDMTDLGFVGAYIEGTGISTGTTITAITSTTITLSAAASGAGSITIRILPFGQGDASTTFNIPDLRGRIAAGRDNMGGTSGNRLTGQTGGVDADKLGSTGGAETVTISQANLPAVTLTTSIASGQGAHTHTVASASGNAFATWGTGTNNVLAGGNLSLTDTATATSSTLPAMTGTTPLGGSGTATNVVQPSQVLNYIIYTGV